MTEGSPGVVVLACEHGVLQVLPGVFEVCNCIKVFVHSCIINGDIEANYDRCRFNVYDNIFYWIGEKAI